MQLKKLSPEKLLEPAYQALLWPIFRDWIKNNFDPEMHTVIGALEEDTPLGLIVVDKHPNLKFATLQTLSGSAKKELLAEMEAYLRSLHTHTLGAEWESTQALELEGWKKGEKKYETYYF